MQVTVSRENTGCAGSKICILNWCHGPDMPLNCLIGRRLGIAALYVICLDTCTYLLVTRLCLVSPTPSSLVLFQRSSLASACLVSVSLDWLLLYTVQIYSGLLLGNGISILRHCLVFTMVTILSLFELASLYAYCSYMSIVLYEYCSLYYTALKQL